jgi:hypothetical protein
MAIITAAIILITTFTLLALPSICSAIEAAVYWLKNFQVEMTCPKNEQDRNP